MHAEQLKKKNSHQSVGGDDTASDNFCSDVEFLPPAPHPLDVNVVVVGAAVDARCVSPLPLRELSE